MGEAKKRRRDFGNLLSEHPNCIFCGGTEVANTVDHVPNIAMFNGRSRPKGLEFPACQTCNNGSKHADLLAAFVSRAWPEIEGEVQFTEFSKYMTDACNNIPGLAWELSKGRGGQKLALNKLPKNFEGGVMNIGPIVNEYMDIFCMKLGLALHFNATGKTITENGGITVRWFSNFDHFIGDFPHKILLEFPIFATLSAGAKTVTGQFEYSSRTSPDKSFGAHLAIFRKSFTVFTAVADDANFLVPKDPNIVWDVQSPKDLKTKILKLAR